MPLSRRLASKTHCLFVCGPHTPSLRAAGKTVVAEYAFAMALRDGAKVVYTSPLKVCGGLGLVMHTVALGALLCARVARHATDVV